jgi:WD40 repeat protein
MVNGNLVISGSSDQTLRQWQVNRTPWLPDVRRLKPLDGRENPAHRFNQAIRVAELLPNNIRQVAVGLDNSNVELWDVDPPAYVNTVTVDNPSRRTDYFTLLCPDLESDWYRVIYPENHNEPGQYSPTGTTGGLGCRALAELSL